MEKAQQRPKIIAYQDDTAIKKRMEEVGIWPQMQDYIELGGPIAIIHGDELFIWRNTPGDEGYSFFKSAFPATCYY